MTNAIKLVPDCDPNAEGEWVVIPEHIPIDPPLSADYLEYFKDYIPEGFHVVSATADLDKRRVIEGLRHE